MSALTFAMSVRHFDNSVTQMKGQHRGKGVRMQGMKGKGKKTRRGRRVQHTQIPDGLIVDHVVNHSRTMAEVG